MQREQHLRLRAKDRERQIQLGLPLNQSQQLRKMRCQDAQAQYLPPDIVKFKKINR